MKDIEIILDNKPGALALMGETLGKNKISLEGGGVFQNGEISIAHFLVEEADRAKEELAKVQIEVVKINDVIIQKLRQDVAGQLVVDDYEKGKKVSEEWIKEWWS